MASVKETLEEMQKTANEIVESTVHESEELDELSKKTLGDYVKAAGRSSEKMYNKADTLAAHNSSLNSIKQDLGVEDKDTRNQIRQAQSGIISKEYRLRDKADLRRKNIGSAISRLTKESETFDLDDYSLDEIHSFIESDEFESLDELSKKTLGDYLKAAGRSSEKMYNKADTLSAHNSYLNSIKHDLGVEDKDTRDQIRQAQSGIVSKETLLRNKADLRRKNMSSALGRLTKESIDLGSLFQGEELTEEFKTKATTIFEAAVSARVNEEVARIEEELASQAELQSEELKEGLNERVDGYLDFVAEQWMKNNVIALDRGIKADLFESFMTGMKGLFEEHYVNVPERELDALAEMQEQVAELEKRLDESTAQNVEFKQALKEVSKQSQIEEATEGLTELEADRFKSLAESLAFDDEESFSEKLSVIRENYFSKNEGKKKSLTESVVTDSPINEEVAPRLTGDMASYANALSRSIK